MEPCLRPCPGPLYWDWRCVNCSHSIREHLPFYLRWVARLHSALERREVERAGDLCSEDLIDNPEITRLDGGYADLHWTCCGRTVSYWRNHGSYRYYPEEIRAAHEQARISAARASEVRL